MSSPRTCSSSISRLSMTVKELMKFLSKFDEDKNVVFECDDYEGKWYEFDEDGSSEYDDILIIGITY